VLDVGGRRCLVVGGGRVALGKARNLVAAGADVTVVAPEVLDELRGLPGVVVEERSYRSGEAAEYRLVIVATGDPAVGAEVFHDGEAAGVWVNAADDPAHCSFILPAVARQGPVQVAVSTGGGSPAFASWLRDQLAASLGPEHERAVQLLAEHRQGLRSAGTPTEGLPWREALDAGLLDLVRQGRDDEAREIIRTVTLERTRWQ
jgi:siroheme synthase-like protein